MKPHFILFLLPLVLLALPAARPDLTSDRSALLALRATVGGRSLLWNISSPTPCSFIGVICDSGRVTELHLPGMGLSGRLPENTLGNLTSLNTLSLRYNALSGSTPADLSKLTGLRNLYLQSNLFTGPVPDSVFSLPNLVRLNLASNKFSGPISPRFKSLTRLATLFLENNNLNGSIPVLDQPSLVQLNVSNNHLTGSIPAQLEKNPASAFSGNSDLCGKPLPLCDGSTNHHKKKLSSGAIAGIIIGSVIGFLLLLALLICCCMKFGSKKKEKTVPKEVAAVSQTEIEIPEEKADGARAAPVAKKAEIATGLGGDNKSLVFFGKKADRGFDLEDLLRASAEVLGKGTFGTAYKAALEGGTVVAVKRLKEVTVPEKEFREKIEVVGRMDHENLVPLRAYYFSRDEKLMVYDYMPMGSLSALLHGNRGATRTPLNWETRSSIALGASRGIAYLHSQGPTVSHGNVKSSNILLTTSYEARVSDFGLSQLAGPTPTPNRVEGYRAPEVTDPRKVSQKADVYSFGVLILELLTGKAPTQASNEDGVDLPRWVQSVVREEWNNEVFDPELLRYQSVDEEMVQLLQLAIDCVAQYPDNRPSMSDVSRRIEDLRRSSVGNGRGGPVEDVIQSTDESGAESK